MEWARRFILFHGKRHPAEMGAPEIEAFPKHLAVAGNVAPSTQNQALHALLFLYCEHLQVELPTIKAYPLTRQEPRRPEVFTQSGVQQILAQRH